MPADADTNAPDVPDVTELYERVEQLTRRVNNYRVRIERLENLTLRQGEEIVRLVAAMPRKKRLTRKQREAGAIIYTRTATQAGKPARTPRKQAHPQLALPFTGAPDENGFPIEAGDITDIGKT